MPLVIKNSTGIVPTFTAEPLDMVSGEGSGSTAFEYVPVGEAPRGAGSWLQPLEPASFSIPAREQRELDVVIEVPRDAGAGGHFAALMFNAPDPRTDSQIRIAINQPIAFFITVRGEFERDVRVRATPTDRWRWTAGEATWDVRISNEGDVHEPVSGRVRLDGLLGGGVRSVLLEPALLFPGETRIQRVRFDLRSAPDLLTAEARVDLDDAPTETDEAPRVVLLPWWILIVAGLAVAVIALRLRLRGRRHGTDDPLDGEDDAWIPPAASR